MLSEVLIIPRWFLDDVPIREYGSAYYRFLFSFLFGDSRGLHLAKLLLAFESDQRLRIQSTAAGLGLPREFKVLQLSLIAKSSSREVLSDLTLDTERCRKILRTSYRQLRRGSSSSH